MKIFWTVNFSAITKMHDIMVALVINRIDTNQLIGLKEYH